MRIKEIRAAVVDLTPKPTTAPRPRTGRMERPHGIGPMARYPAHRERRSSWQPKAKPVACVVTADDGTFGLGISHHGRPVADLINDHLGPLLIGEPCLATEKLFDMLTRAASPYGNYGLASYAISAIDLALWDLKGKLLGRPVYELLGGPQKERILCYATGVDIEWYAELGFKAVKFPLIYEAANDLDGLRRAEEQVARARAALGDDIAMMVDCWLGLTVDATVQLAETLRPYRLRWLEDYLLPEDLTGYAQVRQRLPWQTLAGGEHWYMPGTFWTAISQRMLDIIQPDVRWAGGISACVRICHMAEAAGLSVITHGGMNDAYGQHLAFAMPAITWGERSDGVSPPGVPLAETTQLPGSAVIQDGYLIPNDAPGFGLEVTLDWLESITL